MNKALRVCLVVGSESCEFCGVKGYALRLADALRVRGVVCEVRGGEGWGLAASWRFVKGLRAGGFDVVHVQYPSVGFRYSLVPLVLGIMRVAGVVCVTMHEYGSLPWVQRVAMRVLARTAGALVFTTDGEMRRFWCGRRGDSDWEQCAGRCTQRAARGRGLLRAGATG